MTTNFTDFEFYGLRADDAPYKVGDVLPESRVWEDGEATQELLQGTSATEIRCGDLDKATRIHLREGYTVFAHRYILASNSATYGEDASEIILRNAVVVEVL